MECQQLLNYFHFDRDWGLGLNIHCNTSHKICVLPGLTSCGSLWRCAGIRTDEFLRCLWVAYLPFYQTGANLLVGFSTTNIACICVHRCAADGHLAFDYAWGAFSKGLYSEQSEFQDLFQRIYDATILALMARPILASPLLNFVLENDSIAAKESYRMDQDSWETADFRRDALEQFNTGVSVAKSQHHSGSVVIHQPALNLHPSSDQNWLYGCCLWWKTTSYLGILSWAMN